MNYALNKTDRPTGTLTALASARRLWPFLAHEKARLAAALAAMLANAGLTLLGPLLAARAIDRDIAAGNLGGLGVAVLSLLGVYALAFVASFLQTRLMGGVGQRLLARLRAALFAKLQELPVAFFNQNKAGDLISRINNDTDKLNQFFSQALMQFIGSIFLMIGAAVFLLSLHPRLGAAALVPALGILLLTGLLSGWVRRANKDGLKTTGLLSAEIQESLDNFRVIVAFNRRDYFRRRFGEVNDAAYRASMGAGLANTGFTPVYALGANLAQLAVLGYGVLLITQGQFTVGLLIGFLSYVTTFYNPLRQLAALWTTFQGAMAGWDRVSEVLALSSNLERVEGAVAEPKAPLLEFRGVRFHYAEDKDVLRDVNLRLEAGKTYALVGPTGGGKTTSASLMARLYDPTAGTVLFGGRDLRAYAPEERAARIGFILQDPFLFSGTLRDNLVYGHPTLSEAPDADVEAAARRVGLGPLLERFDRGLSTPVALEGISLGQRQLIAFARAVLREPDLLILDEATANVDTVTEQALEEILKGLPAKTTRVIIAHRLNTIENADEIFFVNGGEVVQAGSLEHAVDLLLHGHRAS